MLNSTQYIKTTNIIWIKPRAKYYQSYHIKIQRMGLNLKTKINKNH